MLSQSYFPTQIIIVLVTLSSFHTNGQSLHAEYNSTLSFPQLRLTEIGQDFSRITFDNTSNPNKFWTIAAEPHSTGTPRINFFYKDTDGGNDRFTVTGSGKVGIKETNPTANLHVNGTTKLGGDAPSIKMKKLTGTFPNLDTDSPTKLRFPHGISDHTKILGFHMHVEGPSVGLSPVSSIPPFFQSFSNAKYGYIIEQHNIAIYTTKSNSTDIADKPYRILIIYEE